MACNAIAQATATVNLSLPENQQNLLTPETARQIIFAVLEQKYGVGQVGDYTMAGQVLFAAAGKQITFRNGFIKVVGGYDEADNQELANEVMEVLQQAVGILFVQQVAAQVGQMAFVEASNLDQAGTMTMTIEI